MSNRRASEIWQEIKPYAMQDIKALQSKSKIIASSVGYQITLHAEKTRYYEASEAGLAAAIAAAVSGNMISLPPSTIEGDHSVPAGVSLFGVDRNRSILTGQISLASNAHLGKMSVIRSGASGAALKGVILTGNAARLNDCVVDVTNTGGEAVGVYCNTGISAYVDDCFVSATGSTQGYGCYVNNGTLYIQSGRITGSTGATGGLTVIYQMVGIENIFKGTASIAWDYDEFDETIEADVLPAGVDHDSLLNFVGNEHVDHEDVEIIAGNGLTGGGDLLASRTLDLTVPGTLGPASANDATENHTHAIDNSYNPGAAAKILATNASGYLQLERLGIGLQIGSDDYVSQTTGWGISHAGAGDFRSLYADQVHSRAFVTDLEQALAGGQMICKSAAPLASDFTVPAAGESETLVVESFGGFPSFKVFEDGDVIRLRVFDRTGVSLAVTDCWGTVTWASTDTTAKTQTYSLKRSAGDEAGDMDAAETIGAGALALDYGMTGNGFIESNAVDGAMGENSPYLQVGNWQYHPGFEGGVGVMAIGSSLVVGGPGLKVRTRMGNLKGIFAVSDEYGLYAGSGATESDRYLRISNKAVEAHNLPISMYDGATETLKLDPDSPSFALGTPLPTGFLSGNGIWMGKDVDGDYKLRIGDPAGERLEWDGIDLALIDAHLQIGSPGGPQLIWDGSALSLNDAFLRISGDDAAIAIGTTPPTASDAGTGIWIDKTGYYGLLNGTAQVKIDAGNGTLYAGGGNVEINEDGIQLLSPLNSPIDKSNITWKNQYGTWNEITAYNYNNGSGSLGLSSYYVAGAGGGSVSFNIFGLDGGTSSHVWYGYDSSQGYHYMYLNGVRAFDIFSGALLVGTGGTVPIQTHQSGDIWATGEMTIYENAWFGKNVSALSFTDRTPFFKGDALAEIMKIKGKRGKVDHASLPEFARKKIKGSVTKKGKNATSEPVEEDGRDLGAMVSLLTVAMQQVNEKIEKIEKSINK